MSNKVLVFFAYSGTPTKIDIQLSTSHAQAHSYWQPFRLVNLSHKTVCRLRRWQMMLGLQEDRYSSFLVLQSILHALYLSQLFLTSEWMPHVHIWVTVMSPASACLRVMRQGNSDLALPCVRFGLTSDCFSFPNDGQMLVLQNPDPRLRVIFPPRITSGGHVRLWCVWTATSSRGMVTILMTVVFGCVCPSLQRSLQQCWLRPDACSND